MIGTVCDEHMKNIDQQIKKMQSKGIVPKGEIKFDPVKIITTDCIKGNEEDYSEVKLKRETDSVSLE